MADATDWQQYSLLEGEANVYFENSFIGKTILDPAVANDTLHFSLGRDNGIRMQRTKVSARSTRRLLASNQEQDTLIHSALIWPWLWRLIPLV